MGEQSARYRSEAIAPETFDVLVPLMKDAFGADVDVGYFDWKYRQNPAGPAIGRIAIAADTGEIAAFYGMIPESYRMGAERVRVYQSCDTMTHTRHRRQGLFNRLALETYDEALKADPKFLAIGFSGPASTPGFMKMKWNVAAEIPSLFKPRILCWLGALGGGAKDVETSNQLAQSVVELMQANERGRENSKVYDAAFLQWRLRNPRRNYTFLHDPGNAYAIVSANERFLFLFDFWERTPKSGKAVMRQVQAMAAKPGSKGLLTFCQRGSTLERTAMRYGFLRNDFGRGPASFRTPFITFGGERGDARMRTAGVWDISPIDHDSY
jgi:hypothetical protein